MVANVAETDEDVAGTRPYLWPGIPVFHVVYTMKYARQRLGLI